MVARELQNSLVNNPTALRSPRLAAAEERKLRQRRLGSLQPQTIRLEAESNFHCVLFYLCKVSLSVVATLEDFPLSYLYAGSQYLTSGKFYRLILITMKKKKTCLIFFL